MAKILPIIFAMAVFGWGQCPQSITDPRDGNVYRTVETPNKHCWMAENIRYKAKNNERNENKIEGATKNEMDGETYSWWTATDRRQGTLDESGDSPDRDRHFQGICFSGWHVSTIDEWLELGELVNPSETHQAEDFLSTVGWKIRGKNTFGLDVKNAPIVYWYRDVPDHSIGPTYWTSTYQGGSKAPAIVRFDDGYTDVNYGYFAYTFENAFYVRCVKDRKAKPPAKVPPKSRWIKVPCIDIITGEKQLCDEESFL